MSRIPSILCKANLAGFEVALSDGASFDATPRAPHCTQLAVAARRTMLALGAIHAACVALDQTVARLGADEAVLHLHGALLSPSPDPTLIPLASYCFGCRADLRRGPCTLPSIAQ